MGAMAFAFLYFVSRGMVAFDGNASVWSVRATAECPS